MCVSYLVLAAEPGVMHSGTFQNTTDGGPYKGRTCTYLGPQGASRLIRERHGVNEELGILQLVGVGKGVAHPPRYLPVVGLLRAGCRVGWVVWSDEGFGEGEYGRCGK